MKILVGAPHGRTGRHVIDALRQRPEALEIIGLSRESEPTLTDVTIIKGDMEDSAVVLRAMSEIDAVVYYGPPLSSRETFIGVGMIDAAVKAKVGRFILISVIHPEIDDLMNHQAKLAVEAHLINSGLDWTVLRPQHYMQNVDVLRAVEHRALAMPYPPETTLGQVDLNDVAEAAAKVAVESGHSFATYDLASNEHLSVIEISRLLSETTGVPIRADRISVETLLQRWQQGHEVDRYTVNAFHRLFGYYSRHGIYGNANVLTWLLGRPATSFKAFIERELLSSM